MTLCVSFQHVIIQLQGTDLCSCMADFKRATCSHEAADQHCPWDLHDRREEACPDYVAVAGKSAAKLEPAKCGHLVMDGQVCLHHPLHLPTLTSLTFLAPP